MLSVKPCDIPDHAFLRAYAAEGAYADCYVTDIHMPVSQTQYIQAFYTTPLFRLERLILTLAVSRPSTDEDVQALAQGSTGRFSAWDVEKRDEAQLLLRDFMGRTRSWLMAKRENDATTRLYFGSAVVPKLKARPYDSHHRPPLLAFHRLYSVFLLSSATSRLLGSAS